MKQLIKQLETDPNQTAIGGIVAALKELDKQQESAKKAKDFLIEDIDCLTKEIKELEESRNQKMKGVKELIEKITKIEDTAKVLIETAETLLSKN